MKRLRSGKLIIVLVVALALLGGVATYLFGLPLIVPSGSLASTLGANGSPSPSATSTREATLEPGMMYAMKERIVNLADSTGFHYLKIELVLEFELPDVKGLKGEAYKKRQDEFVKEMASRRPIMEDIVTTILAGKTSLALSSAEGKEKLREELTDRLGHVSGEHRLLNVYFTQFIIQ